MRQAQESIPSSPMSQAELDDALTLHSPVLLQRLYEASIRAFDEEIARKNRIEAKLMALQMTIFPVIFLMAIGIYLRRAQSDAFSFPFLGWMMLLAAIFSGVVCTTIAFDTLRVQQHGSDAVNERTLFSKQHLLDADSHEPREQRQAVSMFFRTMTPHYWKMVQNQQARNDIGARLLRHAQFAFGAFIWGVWMLALVIIHWNHKLHGTHFFGYHRSGVVLGRGWRPQRREDTAASKGSISRD